MSQHDIIAVIDCGGQDTQLVARRIRASNVYCEIFAHEITPRELNERSVSGVVLVGDQHMPVSALQDVSHPTLAMGRAQAFITPQLNKAHTPTTIPLSNSSGSSGDQLLLLVPDQPLYGTSVDVAAVDSPQGRRLLSHFLFEICGCRADWTPQSFTQQTTESIRRQIGSGRAIAGLSGGVDSVVAAMLVHRAIADRLTCIFVDHGLLRAGESERVLASSRQQGLQVIHVDARRRFLERLAGVSDPEQKRKIIGEEFIRVFEEEADKLGPIDFLMQGTVYSDVVESGGGTRGAIKSHHNVGGLPERMRLQLVEPLRQLFKDEVRQVGQHLGLPDSLVWRHPFPGPGLALRIIGDITEERLEMVRKADAIVVEEIRRAGLYREVWQCFAVLTSTRSVGVTDHQRTYGYTVAIRAVTGEDGMTANWARLSHDLIDRMASRIIDEVSGVNRVVYDVTSKPPATIEWE